MSCHLILGEGANLAMLDEGDLALAIASGPHWQDAVRDYELQMFARAAEAAVGAAQGLDEPLSPDGLAHSREHMKGHQAPVS